MTKNMSSRLRVVIVGAGLGGLACAIACRQQDLEVIVLERAAEFLPVGAGIQIPPNASRVMHKLGLYEKLKQHGAVVVENITMRSYSSGRVLGRKPAGDEMVRLYGSEWMVIHRAKYQKLLLDEALRLGAEVRTDCEVIEVETGPDSTSVKLRNGQTISADAVIGADGLWSQMRNSVLGFDSPPSETGDLAYRGTFSPEQLQQIGSAEIQDLLETSDVHVWLGPDRHVVFYPVNDRTQFNLVLLRPDNLPPDVRNELGSLDEMRETFQGWDPRLTQMIAQLKTALKWKLCHHEELETWVKGCVALLGDASHPTLPYQAQGAAMAVEDGLVIGTLLGRLQSSTTLMSDANRQQKIHEVLKIYEEVRKDRTTLNVKGALQCRDFYHQRDGDGQVYRDEILQKYHKSGEWPESCEWNWGDPEYQQALLGFDVVEATNHQFDLWNHQARL